MSPPSRFTLPCPWCDYYVDAAVDSGAGEAAAALMDAHAERAHEGKNWHQSARVGIDQEDSNQP